jgi:hypothetical protein
MASLRRLRAWKSDGRNKTTDIEKFYHGFHIIKTETLQFSNCFFTSGELKNDRDRNRGAQTAANGRIQEFTWMPVLNF